jgi:hypothetical protein
MILSIIRRLPHSENHLTITYTEWRSRAVYILHQFQAKIARESVPAFCFVMLHLGLGDTNRAIMWLEKAYQEHYYALSIMTAMPDFDPLRSDPRFQQILKSNAIDPVETTKHFI